MEGSWEVQTPLENAPGCRESESGLAAKSKGPFDSVIQCFGTEM